MLSRVEGDSGYRLKNRIISQMPPSVFSHSLMDSMFATLETYLTFKQAEVITMLCVLLESCRGATGLHYSAKSIVLQTNHDVTETAVSFNLEMAALAAELFQ